MSRYVAKGDLPDIHGVEGVLAVRLWFLRWRGTTLHNQHTGEWGARPGWRITEVRRHLRIEHTDPNNRTEATILDYDYGGGLNGRGLQIQLSLPGRETRILRMPAPVVEALLAQANAIRWSPTNGPDTPADLGYTGGTE